MQTSIRLMLSILVLCFLLPFLFQLSADEKINAGSLEPELIDPTQEGLLDFLDKDTNQYLKKAWEAYQEKNYDNAAKYYIAYIKRDYKNATAIYNLACCYGLLGNEKLAAKNLERAYKAGFTDLNHISNDTDFDRVKDGEAFKAVIANIKKKQQDKQKDSSSKIIYLDSKVYLKCNLHFPQNYDSTKSYPLVVGLHGYGGNCENFVDTWKHFDGLEFIFATPQAPYAVAGGNNFGYSWALNAKVDEKLNSKMIKTTEDYIAETVRVLKNKYRIADVYLFGFSQGGFFTYQTGICNHELFKGLICFGAWLDTDIINEKQLDNAKNLKVFIAHGKEDPAVPFEDAMKARDILLSHGYKVTFAGFEGGHVLLDESIEQVVEWMK
ncbi:hypothetical protein K9N50_02090 [bacterium]|nr:hypothetical protein [bacterium]